MSDLAERIEGILKDCLYRDEELPADGSIPEGTIKVQGLVRNFGFHPGRIVQHKEEVRDCLNQMPDEFHKERGGGCSFLNLCMDRSGHQWGEHTNVEQLVVLGIAAGFAAYQMPREMWSVLPGGMPYIVFNTV
jgi:hypothetical protein